MKILKRILLFIVAIIAVLLIVALFLKKDYTVSREVVINKPKQEVFDYIKILKNQDHYNKWVMMDPNSKRTYTGTDGTVGFIAAWDSEMKDVGKGEQEIKSINEGNSIDLEIRFERPFEGKANVTNTTEAVSDNQTRVKMNFKGIMKYPMNIIPLFCSMDKMLGKDIDTTLTNLKNVLEKQ